MSKSVLIVEDDLDFGSLLKQYLEINGFEVVLAGNGRDGKARLREASFDIVLTDVMMPVEDGFTFAADIAIAYPRLPFLFITARKMKEDVMRGLKIGADDYIIKPFDADELVLRIQNILKRTSENRPILQSHHIGHFKFSPKDLVLDGPNGKQLLTDREAQLLEILSENAGRLVRKREILKSLWKDDDFFSGRSMDVFVSRLRKYLSADPRISLESIRGAGLRLIVENS